MRVSISLIIAIQRYGRESQHSVDKHNNNSKHVYYYCIFRSENTRSVFVFKKNLPEQIKQ